MADIILAELGYSGGTLRFSTGAGYNHPSAPGYYAPRIVPSGVFSRSLWADATGSQGVGTPTPSNGAPLAAGTPGMVTNAALGGAGQSGWGDLLIAHLDADPAGGQNLLGLLGAGIAFDGYPVRLLIGDENAVYSDFIPWFVGTVEQLVPGANGFAFRLRDPLVGVIEQPISSAKYAGGDTGYAGVEGLDTTIRYSWKPTGYGWADNASPIPCNSGRRIWQCFDAAGTVTNVWDGGAAIPAGVNRGSLASLIATAPAAGTFDWYGGAEGTFLKLGTPALHGITFTGYTGGAGTRTAAQIWKRILTERCGIAAGSISVGDVAALDAACPAELSGLWYGNGGSRKDALDKAAASVGAAWWVDATGIFRIRQIGASAVAAGAVLRRFSLTDAAATGDIDIVSFEWIAESGGLWGVPPHTVSLSHAVNLTPQNQSALGGDPTSPTDAVGGLDRRIWLEQATRQACSPKDAATAALHLLSTEGQADTWLRNLADAVAEATRRQAALVALRRPARCVVPFTSAAAAVLDLGKTVVATHPDYGLGGTKMLVVGMAVDLFASTIELMLRG